MLTVRFPTGLSVTYNDANTVSYEEDGRIKLVRRVDGSADKTVAVLQTGAGAMVEFMTPCRVEREAEKMTLDSALTLLSEYVTDIKGSWRGNTTGQQLAKLKKALNRFDLRSHVWRQK